LLIAVSGPGYRDILLLVCWDSFFAECFNIPFFEQQVPPDRLTAFARTISVHFYGPFWMKGVGNEDDKIYLIERFYCRPYDCHEYLWHSPFFFRPEWWSVGAFLLRFSLGQGNPLGMQCQGPNKRLRSCKGRRSKHLYGQPSEHFRHFYPSCLSAG